MSAVAGTAHQAFMIASTVIWGFYRSFYFDRAAKMFIPEHTREAAFQLFCDLRTNTPKDAAFFKRHAAALQPHTFLGWLAASVVMLCASTYAAVATAIALGIAVAALNVILVLSVLGGVTLAVMLGCTSVVLFVGACIAGSTAFTLALAYTGLASTKFVATSAARLLLGPRGGGEVGGQQLQGSPQQQALEAAAPEEEVQPQAHDEPASQEEADLNADAAAAAEAATERARQTLAHLPGGNTTAAQYAMEKLGLSPASEDTAAGNGTAGERHPLAPASDASGNVPPPSEAESASAGSAIFLTPSKKKRPGSPPDGSDSGDAAARPSPHRHAYGSWDAGGDAGSNASESSQAPDVQGLMDGTFMGSPPHSRPQTPPHRTETVLAV